METDVTRPPQNEGGGAEDIGNIESLLSPISYSEETPFPRDVPGKPSVPSTVHFQGRVSIDCQWGWISSQSVIRCFPICVPDHGTKTCKSPLAVCNEPYQFPGDWFITCSTELKIHNPGVSKLVVGLNFRNICGGVVIWDPLRAQPMKLIRFPSPVTSVAVVSHYQDGGFNGHFFNQAMMAMVGIIAVGMVGGEVCIIDLGLDQLKQKVPVGWLYKNVFGSAPFKAELIGPHETNVALKRHQFIKDKRLIALFVYNETQDAPPTSFPYCNPAKEVIKMFTKRNVRVTALEYIPATGLLIVGFDFGGFQIWRVDTMELVHSSAIQQRPNLIFGFSFSQPIDDPKNYSYLWVMYGKAGLEFGHSHVELHCLDFEQKSVISKKLGFAYKSMTQCIQKLSFRLEDTFDQTDEESEDLDGRYFVRPLKIWSIPSTGNFFTGNLTFFSWESNRPGLYYVGIFDLNQWYSTRMLEDIRNRPDIHLCPYFVAIPVEAVDEYKAIPIYDVQLVPRRLGGAALERWYNPHCHLDIHAYPASLSFKAVSLSQCATSTFQYFGVQEKLLRKLISDGDNLMMKPGPIVKLFKAYGLRPILQQKYDLASITQETADRFFIFATLLDNRRPAMITKFAHSWLAGAFANSGCTVDLILTWISAYTFSLRTMAEQHWANLHEYFLENLPTETKKFVHYSRFIWEVLVAIFTTITRPDEVYAVRAKFINQLSHGLNKVLAYSASLEMVFNAEIMPEREDNGDIALTIVADHERRRLEVKQKLESCPHFDSTLKSIKPMMIDYLMESFDEDLIREQWNVEPGEPLYPPKHVGYVLKMLLWNHEDPKDVARIIAYYLLDIREATSAEQKDKLRGDFRTVVKLTQSEQEEVFHLWLIDKGCRNEGLTYLTQPGRITSEVIPWSAGVAVCAAFGNEDDILQLLNRTCPLCLSSLHISLMSRNHRMYFNSVESTSFVYSCDNEEFLLEFFKVSERMDFLSEFIEKKTRFVKRFVVDTLITYLSKHQNFENDNRLLLIYSKLGDMESLQDQLTQMKRTYDGTLHGEELKMWVINQKLMQTIISTEAKSCSKSIMDFINNVPKTGQSTGPSRQTIYIKAKQVHVTPLKSYETPKLPLQNTLLTRLSKPAPNAFSPLRRYASKLEAVTTPSQNRSIRQPLPEIHTTPIPINDNDDPLLMSPPPAEVAININEKYPMTPGTTGAFMSLGKTNVQDSDEDDFFENSPFIPPDKSEATQAGSASSPNNPVDLESLLMPPPMDHRKSRISMSISQSGSPARGRVNLSISHVSESGSPRNGSPFSSFNNSSAAMSTTTEEMHSILKTRKNPSRRSLELRFYETSQNASVFEESNINMDDVDMLPCDDFSLDASSSDVPLPDFSIDSPVMPLISRMETRRRSRSLSKTPSVIGSEIETTPEPTSITVEVEKPKLSQRAKRKSILIEELPPTLPNIPEDEPPTEPEIPEPEPLEIEDEERKPFKKTKRISPRKIRPTEVEPQTVLATADFSFGSSRIETRAFSRSPSKPQEEEPVAGPSSLFTFGSKMETRAVSKSPSKTSDSGAAEALASIVDAVSTVEKKKKKKTVGPRSRSKTPSLVVETEKPVSPIRMEEESASFPSDIVLPSDDSFEVKKKTRSASSRSRSKTPSLVVEVSPIKMEEDLPSPLPSDDEVKKKTRSRSKTPSLVVEVSPIKMEEDLPSPLPSDDEVKKKTRSRSKTPSVVGSETDPMENIASTSAASASNKMETRASSRGRSKTPTVEDRPPPVLVKVMKPPKGRPVRGFMPELSTVVEDSSLSILTDNSLLDSTLTPRRATEDSIPETPKTPPPPKKKSRKAKSFHEEDSVFESSTVQQEVFDVSPTRSLRSTRSTRGNKSKASSSRDTRASSVGCEVASDTLPRKRTRTKSVIEDEESVFENSTVQDVSPTTSVRSTRSTRSGVGAATKKTRTRNKSAQN